MLEEFLAFLDENGCSPADKTTIKADDLIHNYRIVDGNRKRNGAYQLKITPEFGCGWVKNYRTGELLKWTSKLSRSLTPNERTEIRKRLKAEETAREVARAAAEKEAAMRALMTWNRGTAPTENAYSKRKQIKLLGVKMMGTIIMVPVYIDSAVASVQFIAENGEKRFMKGGRIKGGYAAIAKSDDDKSTIAICEGYATGASVRAATGWPVIVAFSAGNLEHVALTMRTKYPDARIVIAADNDCETEPNIGIEKAKQAAVKIGAHVIWPEIVDNDGKSVDFNDVHVKMGLEAVKERLEKAVIAEKPRQPEKPEKSEFSELSESGQNFSDQSEDGERVYDIYDEKPVDDVPFTILGHDAGNYYFLSRGSGQIIALTASNLGSMTTLFRLAPLEYWRHPYDEKTGNRKIAEFACNHLIQMCEKKGVFKLQNVRGIGVWEDNGRYVMHCGNHLAINGEEYSLYRFKSEYVYPSQTEIRITGEALSNLQASKLRELCAMLSWDNNLSGELLAGWIVIAPVCAALPWRPHIWVTGQSQSGKTTVLKDIIMPMMGEMALQIEGGTTEAGVRQTLGYGGRPVIYDEAESESLRDQGIIEAVLSLARRASSGGKIIKGTSGGDAIEYMVRSAFCFSGINPAIKHRADESRISMLGLKRDTSQGADERYKTVKKEIRSLINKKYAAGMLMRTLQNIETLIANIHIFTDAASEVLCDRRAADQIGAMLAGLYLLTTTRTISHEKAVEWIKKHDWKMHTAIAEQADPEKLIMTIATRNIRYEDNGRMIEDTIGSMLQKREKEPVLKALREHGIWPKKDGIWIANQSPKLQYMLRETPWSSWGRTLKDLEGARACDSVDFSPGYKSRSSCVPYYHFGIDPNAPKDMPEIPQQEMELDKWHS